MKIRIVDGLPFITLSISNKNNELKLKHILVDTGSYSTIISTDHLHELRITYEPDDKIRQIRGVGGTEFVFTKTLEKISFANRVYSDVTVEAGSLDYGFELDGIIGMDLFVKTGTIIDINRLDLRITG